LDVISSELIVFPDVGLVLHPVTLANHHFGQLADVWKHLVLAEVVGHVQPAQYWETHAGSAAYPLSHSPGRDYGIYWFLARTGPGSGLESSTYYREVRGLTSEVSGRARYPGSALLAMRLLRERASFLFCDTDDESIATLVAAAASLGLTQRARCLAGDGMLGCWEAARNHQEEPEQVLVHIDPFEPFVESAPGLSAISLASRLMVKGFKVIYWYGYESPEERAWPWRFMDDVPATRWCGDLCVRSAVEGASLEPISDLAPIIGCGVVCANLGPDTFTQIESLGRRLEALYETATLPGGGPGALHFESLSVTPTPP
jgi:23S rRNA A2030 N6-methylase RlmJ